VKDKNSPRQGRPHIVVVTVRIRHALDAGDALAATLAGAGEMVGAIVTEGSGEPGTEEPVSAVLPGRRR
jgi:hypothetical protein